MYRGVPSLNAMVALEASSMKFSASPTTAAGMVTWSKVSLSMKTKSSPSLYRYWYSERSTVAVSTLAPALKVLSTTLPEVMLRILVRTKAPPLPGLTCWNSMICWSLPSTLRTRPFLKSAIVAT